MKCLSILRYAGINKFKYIEKNCNLIHRQIYKNFSNSIHINNIPDLKEFIKSENQREIENYKNNTEEGN